jgi:uncharacterized FlaG/YvyC family protein
MAAEIEAIRNVAVSDHGIGATLYVPDRGTRGEVSRSRTSENATKSSSPDVGLVFEVDRESRDLVIKIVDRETQKVIRQIPAAEVQRLREAMQSILGTILDRTG